MSVRLVVLVDVLALGVSVTHGQFDDVSNWAAFDPGEHDVGSDPDGYSGAVFDGRYVYFAPWHNGVDFHGQVMRYDTQGDLADASSWTVYDPSSSGVGVRARGFVGGVFANGAVYFAPWHNGIDFHGEVLRYDTNSDFTRASSWATYDAGNHGVGSDPEGYSGAVFDGRYIYFVPMLNNTGNHGEVLRYDTSASFTEITSWAAFDPGAQGIGEHADGYAGGVFDGRYVYFVPMEDNAGVHGEVLRYDTAGQFSNTSSWVAYDPGEHGVGADPDGFIGCVLDGQYVYFVPQDNGTQTHGEVLRYDTTSAFSNVSSWTTYDAGRDGLGENPVNFAGGVTDGQYIYFVPHSDAIPGGEEVLRYDTAADFHEMASWEAFNPVGAGVGSGIDGRFGGVFDGRYVYFAPTNWHQQQHGEVLRYDTVPAQAIPAASEWGLVVMTLLVLSAGTAVLYGAWRRAIVHGVRRAGAEEAA